MLVSSHVPLASTRLSAVLGDLIMTGLLHKLMLLGDDCVGKTALIARASFDTFFDHYDEPNIDDEYCVRQVLVDGQSCLIKILKNATQDNEYPAITDLYISNSEAFLLVYAITLRSSFENIKRWHSRILSLKESASSPSSNLGSPQTPQKIANPQMHVPITLIASKCDRDTDRVVSTQEGQALARELGCEFLEVSAKNNVNVDRAFKDVAMVLSLQKQKELKAGDHDAAKKNTNRVFRRLKPSRAHCVIL